MQITALVLRIRLQLLGIMKLKPPPLRPKHCPPSKSSCLHGQVVTHVNLELLLIILPSQV